MSITWYPTDADFDSVKAWGHTTDAFAAVKDFSFTKLERRWLNPEQSQAYNDYVAVRNEYIGDMDFDAYYRSAKKPIDRRRWEYLKLRKSWFQMPLGWENVAQNGGIVVDLGCGDGDTSQLLIDFVQNYWEKNNIQEVEVNIFGYDLNASRIENAKSLVSSPTERITATFGVADLYEAVDLHQPDYALICGVLEILQPERVEAFINMVCSSVKRGIYVEDLFEQFPGGYPNDKLGYSFAKCGFQTIRREVIMTEPFSEKSLMDPMRIWPNHIDQNLWLEPI